MRALCSKGSPILGNQKVVKTILLCAAMAVWIGIIGYCPAGEQPPPLPPSTCRCDILERKLEALVDRLERLEKLWEKTGEGVTQQPQSGVSTAEDATSPALSWWNWPDGKTIQAAGPFDRKPTFNGGELHSYKTSCANGSCRIQYWWTPKQEE